MPDQPTGKRRRNQRLRERLLARLDQKLTEAVAADLMDQDEADEIREETKALPWALIIPILVEIMKMLMERFQNR